MSPGDGAVVTTSSVVLTGLADVGSTVSVTVGGVPVANVPVASDGTYGATVPLQVGPNAIRAQAATGCGSSGVSPPTTVTYQPVIPAAPVITSPANGATTQSDVIEVGGTAEPFSLVTVLRNGVPAGVVTADAAGAFSVTIALPVGGSTLTATATNSAGTGPPSNSVAVTRIQADTPSVPGGSPPPLVVGPSQPVGGGIALITSPSSGTVVTTPAVPISGTAQPFSTVVVRVDGVVVARLQANATGVFSGVVSLREGDNSITAQQVGGPESPAILVVRKTAMTTPPTITSPREGDVIPSGRVKVEGSALPGSRVTLYADGKAIGWVVAGQDGRFTIDASLQDGRTVLHVTAQLGDSSLNSASVSVYRPVSAGVVAVAGTSLWDTFLAALSAVGGFILLLLGGAESLARQADARDGLWLLMLAGLLALAVMRGWYGLEQMYAIFGWRRHRPVYDALTGKRVRLASWQRIDLGHWMVHKIGYRPQEVAVHPGNREKVMLAPQPLYASTVEFLLSELLLLVGLAAIPLVCGISVYLWTTHPVAATIYAFCGALLIMLQLVVAWAWPKTRWGRVEGAVTGGETVVEIADADSGQAISVTQVNPHGYFASFVSSGHYLVSIYGGPKRLLLDKIARSYRSGYITKHYRLKSK